MTLPRAPVAWIAALLLVGPTLGAHPQEDVDALPPTGTADVLDLGTPDPIEDSFAAEAPAPTRPVPAFDLARTLFRANDALESDLPERAYDLFREIAARRDDLPAAHFNAGISAWRAGDTAGALEAFSDAAHAGDPAITALALDTRAMIELQRAVAILEAATQQPPDPPSGPGTTAGSPDPTTAIAPLERSLAASRDLLALDGASLGARRRGEIAATLLDLLRRQQEQEQQDQQQQDDQQQQEQDGEGEDQDQQSQDAEDAGEGDERGEPDQQDGDEQAGDDEQDGQQQDGEQQDGEQQDGSSGEGEPQEGEQGDGDPQAGDRGEPQRPVDDPSQGGDPTRDPAAEPEDDGRSEPRPGDGEESDEQEREDASPSEPTGESDGDQQRESGASGAAAEGADAGEAGQATEATPARMSRAQAQALLQRIRDRDLARRAYLRALRAEREARDRRSGAPGGRDW